MESVKLANQDHDQITLNKETQLKVIKQKNPLLAGRVLFFMELGF